MNGAVGRRTFLRSAAAAALGTLASPLFALARSTSAVDRAAFTMGSIVTFTVFHDDAREAEVAIDGAIREMKEIDLLMSVFSPASGLSRLNAVGDRAEVVPDPRIVEVCLRAQEISQATGGAFDPTVEPLMELYGFRDDAALGPFPGDAEIARTMEAVGMRNVLIDPGRGTVALACHGTKLDFGGIAVGYAVDRAAAALRSRGITSALINHSGDLYAIGSPPGLSGWEVGIRDPEDADGVVATVTIRDEALCTSGNYENFRTIGGRTIGHILDPATGRGAGASRSATVIARSAVEADALSTAVFILGADGARKVLAGRAGVSALLLPCGGPLVTLRESF